MGEFTATLANSLARGSWLGNRRRASGDSDRRAASSRSLRRRSTGKVQVSQGGVHTSRGSSPSGTSRRASAGRGCRAGPAPHPRESRTPRRRTPRTRLSPCVWTARRRDGETVRRRDGAMVRQQDGAM
eukprot:859187-Prorocentrum_minimum.AAC.1